MTPEQLAEIEARAAAATPGPWEFDGFSDIVPPSGPNDYICVIHYNRDDADFIAASRTDLPALIAEVRRLRDGLAAIEARWREASKDTCFRRHYRETMEQCADELHDLLGGVDDKEMQAEIDKAFAEGEL